MFNKGIKYTYNVTHFIKSKKRISEKKGYKRSMYKSCQILKKSIIKNYFVYTYHAEIYAAIFVPRLNLQ